MSNGAVNPEGENYLAAWALGKGVEAVLGWAGGKVAGLFGRGAGEVGGTTAAPAVDVANLSNKIVRQMASRGWTQQEIVETVTNGKPFDVINKATGGPATEYIAANGKFVVVDNTTKQVLQVSGPGFLPNH
jgi:hypothetical protein